MKRLLTALPLLAALVCVACTKVGVDSQVRNDGGATFKMSVALKLDVFEAIKQMAAMGGEETAEQAEEGIDTMLENIDDKKFAEGLKEAGFEVVKSSTADKDGWKTVEIEATHKDLNALYAKADGLMKDAAKEQGELPIDVDPSTFLPRFYKTDKPDVAKFQLMPALGSLLDKLPENPLDQLDQMDDEMREMVEGQLDQMRGMLAMDEMKIEFKLKVPGKVLDVKGCKKEGDDMIVFTFKGADIGLDSAKTLFGLKDGVYATFQFDPKEFKIALKDPPKAPESKPAPAPKEAPKVEKKDEEEKRGGGEDR
ncbi:MAG TPA: hypothetical protein VEI02_00295 [Planctomycetota bacterium]|nr:hypothetical protein [Planctomycetota bacterium]